MRDAAYKSLPYILAGFQVLCFLKTKKKKKKENSQFTYKDLKCIKKGIKMIIQPLFFFK